MSYATVQDADGNSMVVKNVMKNAAGAEFTVSDDALDQDGNPFTIFGATVEVNPVPVVQFKVTANRVFKV